MLREEFRKSETGKLWSNITITIQNMKFRVEYDYEDLENCEFNSYERHIIWRYEYLGIGLEQVNKKDKEILNRYLLGAKTLSKKETYESGIYIRDVENKIAYNTDEYENGSSKKEDDEEENNKVNVRKNQLLLSEEQIKQYEERKNQK